jgi:hypothetical protein
VPSHAAAAGKRCGDGSAETNRDAKNRKLPHVETQSLAQAGGCSEGISVAPALDTAAAVIIPELTPPCESLPKPKSLQRIPTVPTTAASKVMITGTKSPRRSFLEARICIPEPLLHRTILM